MQKILPKSEFNSFIKHLLNEYEVIAPVKEEIIKYKSIKYPEEIYLKEISLVPPKSFFLPEKEKLFDFKNNKIIESKENIKKRILISRKCDLNALLRLDKVMFLKEYIEKRKNTLLFGVYCENPDEYCFCNSMELEDYYDLFFYPRGDSYYISVGSKKAEVLVKKLKNAKKEVILKQKNSKVLKNKDIEKNYRNQIWKTDVEKCLSCSACTVYCPTCNCFDIKDTLSINLKDGSRFKSSASCQLKSFSRVAGGKYFRDSREARFKHFVYHKIVYYKNKFGKYMCIGCGRCLRACPTKIDWVKTINLLRDYETIEKEKNRKYKKGKIKLN
ncbi:MAG: 4Fe-4S dicluster domain-containing protein [Candidatus Nanoarchaeia archaeon]